MKKRMLIILIILLLPLILILGGCSYPTKKVVVGIIIAKYDRQEYATFRSWFWEQPVYETKYYFVVKYDNQVSEIAVESATYYSFEVNNEYTITIKE